MFLCFVCFLSLYVNSSYTQGSMRAADNLVCMFLGCSISCILCLYAAGFFIRFYSPQRRRLHRCCLHSHTHARTNEKNLHPARISRWYAAQSQTGAAAQAEINIKNHSNNKRARVCVYTLRFMHSENGDPSVRTGQAITPTLTYL